METVQYCILGLSAVSVALSVYLILKIRTVVYLLEQPIVKKMSPALKLKPVKIEDADSHSHRQELKPGNNPNANRGPRPNFERPEPGDRQNRDNQNRTERGPRPEGNGERGQGGDRGSRNDRNDRNFRDRNPRNDRHNAQGGRDSGNTRDGNATSSNRESGERHNGSDRNRNRSESHSNAPEAAASENSNHTSRPNSNSQDSTQAAAPTLAPRRPLPSTVDQDGNATKVLPAAEPVSADVAADAMFMRDDSDLQHGRRLQMKKKPRFDLDEEEIKSSTPEETKA